MTKVETIDKRTRVPKKAILDVADQIQKKFNPQKIVLFGSYAKGTPRPESDVDLLVVMPLSKKPAEQAVEILNSIEFHFGLDLIVKSTEELEERLRLGDFFLRDAVQNGIILYESNC